MKLRPLHDRVLVEPLEAEEKTAGGIIIPDTAKEKPMEGKIVAAGNGARSEDGTDHRARRQVGRQDPLRQVVRYGSENRWAGSPHHEGIRHHGHH